MIIHRNYEKHIGVNKNEQLLYWNRYWRINLKSSFN